MKRTTAITLIVLVVAICIATTIIIHHKEKEIEHAVPTATAIVHFIPSASDGSEPNEQGSCWTGSIAAPYRTDAWRCTVGNQLADPCFEIPGTNKLLCSPTGNDSDDFVLALTQPLPQPIPASTPTPTNWAWKFMLADGTICTPFTGTGTLTADGRQGYYGCSNDTTILGYLNNDSSVWTVTDATLSSAANGLPTVISSKTVSIKTVWQ